ncbi:hypothetical protein DPEC_G00025600 [Dallia pectoralis]|uniref:Uncharacterized protein n=1 Tax=Dallia pectoralis TaxID=75939 RepID=A0ACC2HI14_DALPE|nr:hypothetical protein DPEC_G00025600 [Dallia pectoralis]
MAIYYLQSIMLIISLYLQDPRSGSVSFLNTRGLYVWLLALHICIGPDDHMGPPPPLFGQSRWGSGADVTEGERVFVFENPEEADHTTVSDRQTELLI